jgi:photosystem II stability/assembly factor-like uncharacterized protein
MSIKIKYKNIFNFKTSCILFGCLFYILPLQAQWQKVADLGSKARSTFPIFTYRGNILVRSTHGILLSKDTGRTWQFGDSSDAMKACFSFVAKDSLIFTANLIYGVYYSADSGKTWKRSGNLPLKGIDVEHIVCSGSNIIITTDYDSIYISKDNGQHWIPSDSGIKKPSCLFCTSELSSFVNLGNKTYVFYGNYSFVTYDHGLHWIQKRDSCPVGFRILSIANTIITATGNNEIYISKDSINTWFKVLNSLDNVIQITTDSHIVAAAASMYGGVWISLDSGMHWKQINDGLPLGKDVSGVTILGNYIFVGFMSLDGIIYRRALSEITGIKPEEHTFISNQNAFGIKIYPNPFKHSASMDFERPLNKGILHIYSIKGQEIYTKENIMTAHIELQKGRMASGIYYFKLEENNKVLATGNLEIE